jgi:hypothetical protein
MISIAPAETDDDGFVDIAPAGPPKAVQAPIVISTMRLRGKSERISLSFAEEAFARLEGWPRVVIAWQARSYTLRLRAADAGPFEAYRTRRGPRVILRLPLPAGLKVREKVREPCPHRFEGATLFLIVPPPFRDPTLAIEARTNSAKAAVEMAKTAIPARSTRLGR